MKTELKALKKIATFLFLVFFVSCSKNTSDLKIITSKNTTEIRPVLKSAVTENFDTGTKGAYADAIVTLSSGDWDFNNALLGNLSTDRKNGAQSARITSTGKIDPSPRT